MKGLKGLFIKDCKLVKNQKQFLLMILCFCVLFLVIYQDSLFVISYAAILFTILAISTLSYDEYENGMSFLFTLPFGRNTYVVEKYLFGMLGTVLAVLFSSALEMVSMLVRGVPIPLKELSLNALASLLLSLLVLSVSIPVHLKFGVERSRAALLLTFGILFAAGYGAVYLCGRLGLDTAALLEQVLHAGLPVLGICVLVLCGVFMAPSCLISTHILKRRQF